jgi:hypothetical protein
MDFFSLPGSRGDDKAPAPSTTSKLEVVFVTAVGAAAAESALVVEIAAAGANCGRGDTARKTSSVIGGAVSPMGSASFSTRSISCESLQRLPYGQLPCCAYCLHTDRLSLSGRGLAPPGLAMVRRRFAAGFALLVPETTAATTRTPQQPQRNERNKSVGAGVSPASHPTTTTTTTATMMMMMMMMTRVRGSGEHSTRQRTERSVHGMRSKPACVSED